MTQAKANTTVGFLGQLALLVKSRLIPFLSLAGRLITHLLFRANEKTNYKPELKLSLSTVSAFLSHPKLHK